MSFTLRGRIQTRLAAAVPALLVAIALQRWWAIELVALMLAIGLALDVVYDRAISYQPAWLALPDPYASDPRTVHAYEPHDYGSKVAIVGAGMAAAHEWLNALAAGSEVQSIRRREPTRRPLNVPRPLLTKRGLEPYHRSTPEEHAATLRTLSQPSYLSLIHI